MYGNGGDRGMRGAKGEIVSPPPVDSPAPARFRAGREIGREASAEREGGFVLYLPPASRRRTPIRSAARGRRFHLIRDTS